MLSAQNLILKEILSNFHSFLAPVSSMQLPSRYEVEVKFLLSLICAIFEFLSTEYSQIFQKL